MTLTRTSPSQSRLRVILHILTRLLHISTMSGTTNPNFLAALRKLKIPIDDYQNHENFQSLPLWVDDPLWNDFKKPRYGELDAFELGALKNVRCLAFSQPPQAPPVGATAATAFSGNELLFGPPIFSFLINFHCHFRFSDFTAIYYIQMAHLLKKNFPN